MLNGIDETIEHGLDPAYPDFQHRATLPTNLTTTESFPSIGKRGDHHHLGIPFSIHSTGRKRHRRPNSLFIDTCTAEAQWLRFQSQET